MVEENEEENLLENDTDDDFDFDMVLTGIDTLCMTCVMTPCVCLLTTLTGRLNHLAEQRNKEEGVREAPGQAEDEEACDDRNTRNLAQVKIIKNNEEGSQAKKQGSREEDRKHGIRKEEALK